MAEDLRTNEPLPDERPLAIGFSDLRGFTSYTAKRGDRQAYGVARSFIELAERHVTEQGGAVLKTYGDGVMTSFEAPEGAVRYAVGMQEELRSFNEEHGDEPLSAGIGLTWGPAIRTEDDLFGHSVNFAKRLADLAKGGQIVVSPSLYELVKGQRGFNFRDIGERPIKGLGTERLYEFVWQDEAASIHLADDSLNVVLTEGGRLVLQFAKPIEDKLSSLQEKIGSRLGEPSFLETLERRIVKGLMKRLPGWLETPEHLAGMGIEHPLEDVDARLEGGGLTITLPTGRRLRFKRREIDLADARAFLERFRQLKASPPD